MKSVIFAIVLLAGNVAAARGDFIYSFQFGTSGSGSGQLSSPRQLAVDAAGNIYVADSANNRIAEYNSSGHFIASFGGGSGPGALSSPWGVAIDPSTGNVVVADTGNYRAVTFSPSGTYLGSFGQIGFGAGQFDFSTGAAVDSHSNIYIVDTNNNRVNVFNSSGTVLRSFGGNGSGNGQFSYASGIALDRMGNIYVGDANNNRIEEFDTNGNYLRSIGMGVPGFAFNGPRYVWVDAQGNIFATDNYSRTLEFDATGAFVTSFGSSGFGDGDFIYPEGVVIGANGDAYVADAGFSSVQVFAAAPEPTSFILALAGVIGAVLVGPRSARRAAMRTA